MCLPNTHTLPVHQSHWVHGTLDLKVVYLPRL